MLILTFVLIAVVVVLDQITKFWAFTSLKPVQHMTVIEPIFNFEYVENRGAAFGLGQNMRWFFIIFSVLFIIAFIVFIMKRKITNKLFLVASALILGGTIGNLIDRVINGYVVDFLKITFFPPSFNVADSCLTVGAGLLVIYILIYANVEKNKRV